MGSSKDIDIEAVIKKAVEAGRLAGQKTPENAYKATERRLYAYPFLKEKLKDDQEKLAELKEHGPRGKSKSVVRYQKSGVRLEPEEIYQALVDDLESTIAADEEEIETIEKAMDYFTRDRYIRTVTGRYFDDLDDESISRETGFDTTSIWRHRKKIVQTLAVLLYGVFATM